MLTLHLEHIQYTNGTGSQAALMVSPEEIGRTQWRDRRSGGLLSKVSQTIADSIAEEKTL